MQLSRRTSCCLSCQRGSLSLGERRTLSDLSRGELSVQGWSHHSSLVGTENTLCSIIHLLPLLQIFCDEDLICSSKFFVGNLGTAVQKVLVFQTS